MKVKFSRPTRQTSKNGVAYGNPVRTSKCGRFSIEKFEFDLPVRSTEYRLTDHQTGTVHKGVCDTLTEARELAQDIVDNPQDYA